MEEQTEATPQVSYTYSLPQNCDMPDDLSQEAMEICVTATEKYSDDYEKAARFVKETLDKKFDPSFQVVIGEGFAHAITYQKGTLLFLFSGGNIASLVWKTVPGF